MPDPVSRDLENVQREIRRIEEHLRIWEGGVQVSFLDESEKPATEPPAASEGETPSAREPAREGEDTSSPSAGE